MKMRITKIDRAVLLAALKLLTESISAQIHEGESARQLDRLTKLQKKLWRAGR